MFVYFSFYFVFSRNEYANIPAQTLVQGFGSIGFTPTVQALKEFEDDYGLKVGDEEEEDEEEEDDDEDDESGSEEDSDEDDE